jgi:hypothetical protein
MYRNSAQIKCIGPNALPSPDNTSDSDTEFIDVLEQKRRQLEEEVARFRAAKDREFREFERELRVKKRRSRTSHETASDLTPTRSPASGSGSALNLLASTQNHHVIGSNGSRSKREYLEDKTKRSAPLSGPTLSLDKLNITAETVPPSNLLNTPPTPSLLKRVRSRSPVTELNRPAIPPSQSEKQPLIPTTPTPSKERSDPFTGVFTPAYLPLLDSKDSRNMTTTPATKLSDEDEKHRFELDAASKQQANEQQAHLESSQSLPPQQVSPTVIATKRVKSASSLPTAAASLPSALRTASGGDRRRKHVKFQLADLAVVDPSSSYEEGPSPELEEGHGGISTMLFSNPSGEEGQRPPLPKRPPSSPLLSPGERDKDRRRGRGRNGRFVSPMPSPLGGSPNPESHAPPPTSANLTPSPLSSPALSHATLISTPAESGFSNGLTASEDGGSGVGFFELDEELASPGLREGKVVEMFDLEGPGEDEPEDRLGLGIRRTDSAASVTVGSVPIDIVPRGSSFVGSYGH